jgi:hypothetical protein
MSGFEKIYASLCAEFYAELRIRPTEVCVIDYRVLPIEANE